MNICITGRRPQKLGGFTKEVDEKLRQLFIKKFLWLKPDNVISGMALGADMAAAEAAISLGIKVIAAVPFKGQETVWPESSQRRYNDILAKCSQIVTVCEGGYSASKLQERNVWMVDHSDMVLALWDGTSGGTSNCVQYAERKGKTIRNIWSDWKKM